MQLELAGLPLCLKGAGEKAAAGEIVLFWRRSLLLGGAFLQTWRYVGLVVFMV